VGFGVRADTQLGNTALRPFSAARAHWTVSEGRECDPGTASDGCGKASGTEGNLQAPIADGYLSMGTSDHEHQGLSTNVREYSSTVAGTTYPSGAVLCIRASTRARSQPASQPASQPPSALMMSRCRRGIQAITRVAIQSTEQTSPQHTDVK
jgi:hypothetical protein